MGVLVPSKSYGVTVQGAGDAKNSGISDSIRYAQFYLYAFSGECLIFRRNTFMKNLTQRHQVHQQDGLTIRFFYCATSYVI